VLGLVHVAQRIALRAPLPADARLALRCSMAGHREVDAGQAFELHTVALADGVPAWRATTTFVARQPRPRGASGPSRGAETAPARAAPWAGATVDVPADTGRRYARASGDWNPIHLWGWMARPFGFDRPIAHGMWTLARALGAIDAAHPAQADAARTVDVRFGRPLRLPGTVRVSHGPLDDGAIGFEVAGTDDGRPHASGRVAAGWHDDGPSGPP
jgi:acyl dehydratase